MTRNEGLERQENSAAATPDDRAETRDVQCPNCCKRAPVTARRMGLLFYRCELCGSVGATPAAGDTP